MINPIIWSSHLGILVFIYGTNLLIYWNGTLSDNLKWIKMLKINNCTLNSSSFVFNGSFLNTIGKPKSLVYWFLALGSLLRLNDIQKRCHFRQLSEQSTRENKVFFFNFQGNFAYTKNRKQHETYFHFLHLGLCVFLLAVYHTILV